MTMEDYIVKSIDNIKSFFNLYVITFSSFGILGLIRYLNKKYYHEDKPLKFLDMPVYSEYFSLIFGILFLVFIVVFYLMFFQLEMLASQINEVNEKINLSKNIKLIPWIASPFSVTKLNLFVFIALIALGIIYSLVLSVGHLFFPVPDKCHIPPIFYKLIGAFDAIVFCISTTLMCFLLKYIFDLRDKIGL